VVNPSPNLRSLSAGDALPGHGAVRGTSFSEGRGTDRPFEWIGAPGIDGAAWVERLSAAAVQACASRPRPAPRIARSMLANAVRRADRDRRSRQVRPMELA